ncbi:YdeI family protein [Pseudorhodobacter sp.]|uniref:YdeI/OmpD-associated family protein n=1 Tax=Pseudorhodobacter sp. TaxID=1934400 RepID=UPI0026482351|nr:YdeI/OmpD-associated family protein [Pseudorhodobacter sp.]MDN5785702.1 YdeI/OmpD-associated family protein [Pseudorhodobacter sp.]
MITEVEDFFTKGCGRCSRFATKDCSVQLWRDGLAGLRQICNDLGLTETVKWGHPCYMLAGRNIVLLAAFRDDFRISFFNASLLKDPEAILEKNGPNTRTASVIRFTDAAQVDEIEPVIRLYLQEAMRYAEAGIKPENVASELELPPELSDALDSDPELAEAFHALTPGRQKSYVINLNSAKKPETRRSRITGFRDKIIAGKGALDR